MVMMEMRISPVKIKAIIWQVKAALGKCKRFTSLKLARLFHWFSSVSLDKNSNHQNGARDENIKFGVKKNF